MADQGAAPPVGPEEPRQQKVEPDARVRAARNRTLNFFEEGPGRQNGGSASNKDW